METDDLQYLIRLLERLPYNHEILIGVAVFKAVEILDIATQAKAYRQRAKWNPAK